MSMRKRKKIFTGCEDGLLVYTAPMIKATRAIGVSLMVSACLLGAGCGGFSGSQSVSPATFLLPGMTHCEPPTPEAAPMDTQMCAAQPPKVDPK